jgi:hypothetical protein
VSEVQSQKKHCRTRGPNQRPLEVCHVLYHSVTNFAAVVLDFVFISKFSSSVAPRCEMKKNIIEARGIDPVEVQLNLDFIYLILTN